MNRLRTEINDLRTLQLTKRGEWVRAGLTALVTVPVLYALLIASVAGLEGMGL